MKKNTHRFLSGLLGLCLVLSLLPIFSIGSHAADQLVLNTVELSGIPVPREGQWAATIKKSDIQLQMPEAYEIVENTLYWRDFEGNAIDNERYAFEADKTYYLRMTLQITNSANYAFASKVTATLGGVSASAYTAQVFYPAEGQLQIEFTFKLPGSLSYPQITAAYLTNGSEPVVGETPSVKLDMLYDNYTISTGSYSGSLSGGTFAAGSTYKLTVTLIADANYTFAQDLKVRMDSMDAKTVTVFYADNRSQATAVFEYTVPSKKEVGVVVIDGGVERPIAGRQYAGIQTGDIVLPVASEYKMYAVGNWSNEHNQRLQPGQRFRWGTTYRLRLIFRLNDSTTRVFTDSPRVYVKSMYDWHYDIEIQKVTASELELDLVVKSDFLSNEGLTEDIPASCYCYEDLKGALESTSIRYVSLRDIPKDASDVLPTPPAGSESNYYYYIMTWGTKVLRLDGKAVFRSGWTEKDGYNRIGGLIYNTGNLTITGDGSLNYLAPVTTGYNGAIVNRGSLTVESGTVEASIPTLSSVNPSTGKPVFHDNHACAVYQKLSTAKLTVNGGNLLTQRYVEKAAGQGAVILEGGTAVINGGSFDYEVRTGLTDVGCYGLLIKSANAKVTINSGTFRNVRFPAIMAPSQYIPSDRRVTVNEAPWNLNTATDLLQGVVKVCPVSKKLDIHINAPNAGGTPSFAVHVVDGVAQLYGGTAGIRWYDLTDSKTLTTADTFLPSHRYRVTIELEATGTNLFATDDSGNSTLKATVNYRSATVGSVSALSEERGVKLTYTFDACPAVIDHVDVKIQPPFEGRAIDTAVTFGTGGVELHSLDWYDETGKRFMNPGERFIKDHSYSVQIWIKASVGYEFKVDQNIDPVVTGMLNGKTVKVGRAYEQSADQVVCINYDFGACSTTLELISVYNLDLPQPGTAPDFQASVQEPDKYEIEHVSWTGSEGVLLENDRFQPGVEYTLEIKIVPTKLEGLPLYSFYSELQAYVNAKQLNSADIFAGSKAVYLYQYWTCPETVTAPEPVGLPGDVTGDGKVNIMDVAKLYAHVKGTSLITDQAAVTRADVTGDGRVNILDTSRLYAHVKGTNMLW